MALINFSDYESDEKEGDPGTSSDGGDTTQDKNQATTPAIRTDNVNPTTTISCTTAQAGKFQLIILDLHMYTCTCCMHVNNLIVQSCVNRIETKTIS